LYIGTKVNFKIDSLTNFKHICKLLLLHDRNYKKAASYNLSENSETHPLEGLTATLLGDTKPSVTMVFLSISGLLAFTTNIDRLAVSRTYRLSVVQSIDIPRTTRNLLLTTSSSSPVIEKFRKQDVRFSPNQQWDTVGFYFCHTFNSCTAISHRKGNVFQNSAIALSSS